MLLKVRSEMFRLLFQQEVVRFVETLCSRGNLFPTLGQHWGNSVSCTDTLTNVLPKQLLPSAGKILMCQLCVCFLLRMLPVGSLCLYVSLLHKKKGVLLNFSLPIFKVNLYPSRGKIFLMLHHTESSPSKALLVSTSSVGRISSKNTPWSLQLLQANHPKDWNAEKCKNISQQKSREKESKKCRKPNIRGKFIIMEEPRWKKRILKIEENSTFEKYSSCDKSSLKVKYNCKVQYLNQKDAWMVNMLILLTACIVTSKWCWTVLLSRLGGR